MVLTQQFIQKNQNCNIINYLLKNAIEVNMLGE